jgi:hypothetical protein
VPGDMDERDTHDLFTGTWIFNAQRSKLSTPMPRKWVQKIKAASGQLDVEESISGHDGSASVVTIQARFDGKEYPVLGSSLVDSFAYERDGANISGIGRKMGVVSIRETVVASTSEAVMTLTYSILSGEREVASGVAVFEKLL